MQKMGFNFAKLFLAITCLLVTISCSSSAREFPPRKLASSGSDDLSIWAVSNRNNVLDCWNALGEIKSCTNEIAGYFSRGATEIGPECCKAITVITHNCWATILSAFGITVDQTYILRGYCDASFSTSYGPAQAPIA